MRRRSQANNQQQQTQFFQQIVEQQTITLAQTMNAMADMMRTLQADRVPVKEKEFMTTKRAFTIPDGAILEWIFGMD